jgi:hypothetical protein
MISDAFPVIILSEAYWMRVSISAEVLNVILPFAALRSLICYHVSNHSNDDGSI